jgi:ubiquinol-cytochrome c reductase cytochrome b subunit
MMWNDKVLIRMALQGLKRIVSDSLAPIMEVADHPIQGYANTLPYMLGGLAFVCIMLLMLTGMFMAMFYTASAQGAYSSTINLIEHVPFGEYARSVHLWAANIVIVLIALHLSRIIITGSYKKPRRLLYITGVLMFFDIMLITYMGTVLPLDQIGVDAAIRTQQAAALFGVNIPLGMMVGPAFVFHINVLILALFGLFAVHALLILRAGISPKASKKAVARATAGEGNSTFMHHMRLLIGSGLLLSAAICTLAAAFPAPIGHPGVYDPDVMITKPVEYIFYVNDIMLDTFGTASIIWGPLLLFLLLLVFPALDRRPEVHWRKRIPFIILALFILAWALYFIVIDATAGTEFSGAAVEIAENVTFNPASLYYVSNGTAATAADVYGGYASVPSRMPQEMPAIFAVIASLGIAGAAVLATGRRRA